MPDPLRPCLATTVLILLALSGCVGQEGSQQSWNMVPFMATFDADSTRTLEMHPKPVEALDRDGRPTDLWRLDIQPANAGFLLREYLDANGIVVRQDFQCKGSKQCDNTRDYDWSEAGRLSSSGYAWNLIVDSQAPLGSIVQAQIQDADIVRAQGHITFIRTAAGDEYEYDAGDPVPVRIGALGNRTSISPRIAEGFVTTEWQQAAPHTAQLRDPFPGYDQDPYGFGITPKAQRDYLMATRGSDAAIANGCLVDIVLGPPEPGQSIAVDSVHASRWTYVYDSKPTTYRVTTTRGPIFGEQHAVETVGSGHLTRQTSCTERAAAGQPETDLAAWKSRMDAMEVPGALIAVRIAIGTSHVAPPLEGVFGIWSVEATYTPPYAEEQLEQDNYAAYLPYGVIIDPVHDTFVRVRAPPNHIP